MRDQKYNAVFIKQEKKSSKKIFFNILGQILSFWYYFLGTEPSDFRDQL